MFFLSGISAAFGQIAVFDFQDAWEGAKEPDFSVFSENSPSTDTDEGSVVSLIANNGLTAGGFSSFVLSDELLNTSIFSTSDTPVVGMNVGGANQTEATNYFSFTVTPVEGASVSYGSMSLFTSTFSGVDTYNVELRVVDGDGEEMVIGEVYEKVPEGTNNEPVTKATFDFDDFSSTNVTEWRIYVYNTDNVDYAIRFDDVTLLEPTEEIVEPEITNFSVVNGILSITWNSSPSKSYAVLYSTDLENWVGDFEDGVDGEIGGSNSGDYELELYGLAGEPRVFVRVEEE